MANPVACRLESMTMAIDPRDPELREALTKARLLLSNLDRDAVDFAETPSRLDAGERATGQAALENAMTAARQLIVSLEAALALDDSSEAGWQPGGE